MSDLVEAGRVSEWDPSPQLTVIEDRAPSGSLAVKDIVTVWFVLAGVGERLVIVSVGGLSVTVSDVVAVPCPALLVAVTLMVKACKLELPVVK